MCMGTAEKERTKVAEDRSVHASREVKRPRTPLWLVLFI
jgi:hypothetical protein